jgi:signal transduction histidine kinase
VTPAVEADMRVLVLAPTARDSQITRAVLADDGIACCVCRDLQRLLDELPRGAAALLLAEEALGEDQTVRLRAHLRRQPPWSDLPVLVLTARGADSPTVATAVEELGNVTLLERPTRVAALTSAVRSALRARARQYQIRDHVEERERAAEALLEADRRKDEFLAMLAHELRNPLAPLRSAADLLELSDDPDVVEVRHVIDRQVDHMVRLVDDLLEVSRITRGKIELRRERVDLASVVRTAVETCEPLISAAGHRLSVAIPSAPVEFAGDPVRLAQIVANLLNNAAKYTEDGGRIWLRARRRGDWLVVTVRDDGIGISPEMLPHVFDMFTQADASRRRSKGGLGIGLTLVHRLVQLHGGTVSVRSREGVGSRFVVRLPLHLAPASREERPHAVLSPRPARRVLVVDDNRDAAESLGRLLARHGAEVRVVHDGPSALEVLRTWRPSAAVLDLGMPGMDGLEVARRIRRRPELRDVALIALTGWGRADDVRRARDAGFDHHMVKPADIDALRSLLV